MVSVAAAVVVRCTHIGRARAHLGAEVELPERVLASVAAVFLSPSIRTASTSGSANAKTYH